MDPAVVIVLVLLVLLPVVLVIGGRATSSSTRRPPSAGILLPHRSRDSSGSKHVPQGDLNLDAVGAVVRAELAKGGVRRVVLDSLPELVFAAREAERFPAYARTLVGFIRAAGQR
jgi:hypothetical protein